MKIVTYNMQHDKKSKDNWDVLLDELAPDIVLAQESLPPDQYQRPLLGNSWSDHVVWAPVWPQWGSAIYVASEQPRHLELPDFQGWVVGVELDNPALTLTSNKVRFFSLHAPTGQGSYPKVVGKILDMLLEHRNGCDVVIGGDFNHDVSQRHPSEDLTTESPARTIQNRLRNEFGLVNCWQTMHPDRPLAQTLRWDTNREPAFHCDGIFVPATWAARLTSCEVLSGGKWIGMSDHNPVVAKFAV